MMEINPFILALSKTLPESCVQGLVVYLLLQLLFLVDKRSTPLFRFNLLYVVNWCLFVGFILTFSHYYQQIQINSFNLSWLSNTIGNNHLTVAESPNLWLQINFWTSHYAYLLTGFYLLGLIFCMLKLAIGLININWFRSDKNLKLDDNLTNICIQSSSNFRLIKTVSVFVSDKIVVPLTIGFIKPIIVFPIALINQLSAEQTEAILLHELAHIKRNDYLLNVLLCIVQSFLFFNPAVWLMKREINQYREQCCDDLVMDNSSHKIAYARALLLIETSKNTQLTLAFASNGKNYNLLNRIKRITMVKKDQTLPQNKPVVLLLALITVGLTVAWNLPVKEVLKRHIIRQIKITETKSNGTTSIISTDKVEMQKLSDQSRFKLYTNNINFQPNNRFKTNFTFSGNKIAFVPGADTIIQSKNKFKIVLEDSLGNKKEYSSIDELPAEARKNFLNQNGNLDQLRNLNSDDFKIDTSEIASIKKHFNSPEWKKEIADIRKQSIEIQKYFNGPEWKKQMADIKKQSAEIRKQFTGTAWKKQMADIRKQSQNIQKQFNSAEWKKQMEESTKNLVDSARKNWKKSSDYQHLPASTPIILKPE